MRTMRVHFCVYVQTFMRILAVAICVARSRDAELPLGARSEAVLLDGFVCKNGEEGSSLGHRAYGQALLGKVAPLWMHSPIQTFDAQGRAEKMEGAATAGSSPHARRRLCMVGPSSI